MLKTNIQFVLAQRFRALTDHADTRDLSVCSGKLQNLALATALAKFPQLVLDSHWSSEEAGISKLCW